MSSGARSSAWPRRCSRHTDAERRSRRGGSAPGRRTHEPEQLTPDTRADTRAPAGARTDIHAQARAAIDSTSFHAGNRPVAFFENTRSPSRVISNTPPELLTSSISASSIRENLSLTRSASGSYPQAPQYSILNFAMTSTRRTACSGRRAYIPAIPLANRPCGRCSRVGSPSEALHSFSKAVPLRSWPPSSIPHPMDGLAVGTVLLRGARLPHGNCLGRLTARTISRLSPAQWRQMSRASGRPS